MPRKAEMTNATQDASNDMQNDINKKHRDAKSAAIKEAEQIIISYRRKSEKLIEEIRTKKADKVTVKKIKTN